MYNYDDVPDEFDPMSFPVEFDIYDADWVWDDEDEWEDEEDEEDEC